MSNAQANRTNTIVWLMAEIELAIKHQSRFTGDVLDDKLKDDKFREGWIAALNMVIEAEKEDGD